MTQRAYAENTTVPISRSREELERTLERFGATAQAWMRDDETQLVTLAFKRSGRGYRFVVRLPQWQDEHYLYTPTHQRRTELKAREAADQEARRRFRSLANFVKALMDAADTGIISAEDALLPYLLLPNGETVADSVGRWLPSLEAGETFNIGRALTAGREEG